jgi:hypothetical protein
VLFVSVTIRLIGMGSLLGRKCLQKPLRFWVVTANRGLCVYTSDTVHKSLNSSGSL